MKKLFSVLCASVLLLTGCTPQQQRYRAQFLMLFDTVTEIVGYSPSEELFAEQVTKIHEELGEYHRLFDIYHEYEGVHNLATLNARAAEAPVVVDQRIIDLLLFSKQMHTETNGAVNVAFGSVLKVWKQYREQGIEDPEQAALPPMQELQEAALHTNIWDILIDEEASTVFFRDAALQLDVGAIAKGYAVEQVCQSAEKRGVDHMLVSVGGNVRAIGGMSRREEFVVSVKSPDPEAQGSLCRVKISDASLVSSGDYMRYYTVDGKKYHHIIDPATLLPADQYQSVSIVTLDSGVADALSTAAFLLDFEQSRALVEHFEDAEAIWVLADGSTQMTEGFRQRLAE